MSEKLTAHFPRTGTAHFPRTGKSWGVYVKADGTVEELIFNDKEVKDDKEATEVNGRDDSAGNDGRNCC